MNNRAWLGTLWVLAGMIICQAAAWADDPVMVENAWVRDAPPHAEMSAAYLTIMNHSAQTQTLAAVSSPQFQKVEVHRTVMVNGQVRMRREDNVTVPAHGSLEFKPGGYHLMLIHPLHALKEGDMVELRLQFKDAQPLTIQAQIRESAEEAHPHDMDMHDMKM
jgi:periplasmic copper chaperone A